MCIYRFVALSSMLLCFIFASQGCKSEVQEKYEELTAISLEVIKLRSVNKSLQESNQDVDASVTTASTRIDNLVDSLQILLVNATGGYTTPRKGDMATEFRDARNTEASQLIFSDPNNCQKLQTAVANLLLSSSTVTYTIPEANTILALRSEFTKGQTCQLLKDQMMIDGMILLGKFNLWSLLDQKQNLLDQKHK